MALRSLAVLLACARPRRAPICTAKNSPACARCPGLTIRQQADSIQIYRAGHGTCRPTRSAICCAHHRSASPDQQSAAGIDKSQCVQVMVGNRFIVPGCARVGRAQEQAAIAHGETGVAKAGQAGQFARAPPDRFPASAARLTAQQANQGASSAEEVKLAGTSVRSRAKRMVRDRKVVFM